MISNLRFEILNIVIMFLAIDKPILNNPFSPRQIKRGLIRNRRSTGFMKKDSRKDYPGRKRKYGSKIS
jgi:hypothetical protein